MKNHSNMAIPISTEKMSTPNNIWRAVIATSIGNALEWFDLVVYGFFAATISKLFFPVGNESVSLLLTLGSFGLSFVMRPLGAVVLGAYADKVGRKKALSLTIALMTGGTLVIAVLPTYNSIGIAAPLILLFARLVQGFSAGGEFGSSTAFLVEHALGRRGFFASWQISSQGLTTVLASLFGVLLTSNLTANQMFSWGWRMPFLFGLLIGPVGYYIRKNIDETPEFVAAKVSDSVLRDTFNSQKVQLLTMMGVVMVATVSTYLGLFMPTYAVKQLGLAPSSAFAPILVLGLIQMLLAPLFGHLSDTVGRTKIMKFCAAGILILVVPAFLLLVGHPGLGSLMLVEIGSAVLVTGYFSIVPAFLSEAFSVQLRTTGLSLSYNIPSTLFGGFGPFIMEWLLHVTGSKIAPSYYVMVAAGVSLISLFIAQRKRDS